MLANKSSWGHGSHCIFWRSWLRSFEVLWKHLALSKTLGTPNSTGLGLEVTRTWFSHIFSIFSPFFGQNWWYDSPNFFPGHPQLRLCSPLFRGGVVPYGRQLYFGFIKGQWIWEHAWQDGQDLGAGSGITHDNIAYFSCWDITTDITPAIMVTLYIYISMICIYIYNIYIYVIDI